VFYRDEWRFEVEVTGLKLAPDVFYRRDARLGRKPPRKAAWRWLTG